MTSSGLAPRRLAFQVLLRVETTRSFADALLGEALARDSLPAVDRSLATRLVYGTLAWQRRLDWIADHWSRPPTRRLDPEVRICLRLGLFQLFFSDRIPEFAAVDTTVELVKRGMSARAAPLVNAVLRRAAREGEPNLPEDDAPASLGLRFSHPDWLVERWIRELGLEDTKGLLAANNGAAPFTVRLTNPDGNPADRVRSLSAHGVRARPGRYSPLAIVFEDGVPDGLIDAADEFVAQGEASQLVPFLLGARAEQRILDACAAPGGKSTALAELVRGRATIVAADPSRPKVRRVRDLARRLRSPGLHALVADAIRPPFRSPTFDCILVDAPCTGVGTLRSHPEIRWRLTPADVSRLAERQRAILDGIAPCLRPAGTLVYATCSLLREENDAVVASFLASHPDFARADAGARLPEGARPLARDGALRTFPHRDGLDGFFAAALERRAEPALPADSR